LVVLHFAQRDTIPIRPLRAAGSAQMRSGRPGQLRHPRHRTDHARKRLQPSHVQQAFLVLVPVLPPVRAEETHRQAREITTIATDRATPIPIAAVILWIPTTMPSSESRSSRTEARTINTSATRRGVTGL